MNRIKYILLLGALSMVHGVFAQKANQYLLKIDNKTISGSDFEYAYLKNKKNNTSQQTSLDEFLKGYILLKTKVAEAESLGLNHDPLFVSEYNQYAETAKQSYTNDTTIAQNAAKLIYDRLLENVEVGQVFMPFASDKVFPKDTLRVYNQIINIRESVVDASDAEFRKLARQYPAPNYSNKVETSWQTALMGSKALEDAVYTTPTGTISQPVRTNEGYYLIKVYAKRKDRGEVRISHMLFQYPDNATQAEKDSVRSLSQKVIGDLDKQLPFEAICKLVSADRKTAEQGGDLGWFSTRSNLIPMFDSIFFSLKNKNDYTRPIEFDYGFHIFKLTGKSKLDPWPEIKPDLIKEMTERHRGSDIESLKLKKLADKYPYSVHNKAYRKILDTANIYHASDSLFFKELPPLYTEKLLTVGNQNYTVNDFVSYIYNHLSTNSSLSTDIIEEKLNEYILTLLSKENEDKIVDNTPELRLLLQEYYDGLLLFAVMDKEVWEKARSDAKGLAELFEQHRDKYRWNAPKYKGYVICLKDQQAMDQAKALEKKFGEQADFPRILIKALNNDSVKPVYMEKGIWGKGENDFVDNVLYKSEIKRKVIGYPLFFIHGKITDQPETYEDVKGEVETDYQAILEKQWVENITRKHKIDINNQELDRLKIKYNQ